MHFIHTADVHLGAVPDAGFPWSNARAEEIKDSFRRLVELVREEKPELFLIAGDLFHRQPLKRELKEVNYLFSTIPDTTVVMIAGNHDYIREDSWYLRYPWCGNVIGLWNEEPQRVYIPKAGTWVYGCSYHERERLDPVYDRMKAGDENGIHILLAHGGDDRHIPVGKELICATGFDYIALGHIHRPQTVIPRRARYCGALEPLDRNDLGAHGFVRGRIENGVTTTEFVPWAVRSYIPLTATVSPETTQLSLEEQTLEQILREGRENIFRIQLFGSRDPQMNFDLLRLKRLGNIIDIRDETRPDYDLDLLAEQYEGHLIGSFIGQLRDSGDPVREKALYYGLQALLETREHKDIP